jgi:nucleotide-binding universal stress UspA family protein
MRTILVPVDSTATSENAVDFAVEWGKKYGYDHIILLRTSYESMFDYMAIGATYALANEESLNKQQEEAKTLLEHLRRRIIEKASAIQVTTEISELPLLRCTIELIRNNASVELIVLGSDHKVVSNDSFVSANIISIARASPVKVLIVPNIFDYKPVENILVPCDVSNIEDMERLGRLRSGFERENTRVMLLNVDTKEDAVRTDIKRKKWEEELHRYLPGLQYSVHYAFDKDIINGILSFTSSHKVDLIIALPGRHSFLYYLASRSISEGIYRNVHHAVLILK